MRIVERAEKRFLIVLVGIAIAFNVITLSPVVPWQSWTTWDPPQPVAEYRIHIENYTFETPSCAVPHTYCTISVPVQQPVRFVATSGDVTYGFGVFRKEGGMLFQMQVLPGHENSIIWVFDAVGSYDVRSTEYSGPGHPTMFLADAVQVVP